MTAPTRLTRASPLPADERRAHLVRATVPLLIAHGAQVTTREIAAAAGVAEGTIFRVFADKDALISECVAVTTDVSALYAALENIDLGLPLRERLTQIVTVLQTRLVVIIQLMTAVQMNRPPHSDEEMQRHRERNDRIYATVEWLLTRDADAFSMPLHDVARLVRLLTFSGSHQLIADGELLTPAQIVGLLLDGVCRPPTSD